MPSDSRTRSGKQAVNNFIHCSCTSLVMLRIGALKFCCSFLNWRRIVRVSGAAPSSPRNSSKLEDRLTDWRGLSTCFTTTRVLLLKEARDADAIISFTLSVFDKSSHAATRFCELAM